MLKAKQAYKLATKNMMNIKLQTVLREIKYGCDDGRFSVMHYGTLPDKVINKLIKLGYTVTEGNLKNYEIGWELDK